MAKKKPIMLCTVAIKATSKMSAMNWTSIAKTNWTNNPTSNALWRATKILEATFTPMIWPTLTGVTKRGLSVFSSRSKKSEAPSIMILMTDASSAMKSPTKLAALSSPIRYKMPIHKILTTKEMVKILYLYSRIISLFNKRRLFNIGIPSNLNEDIF